MPFYQKATIIIFGLVLFFYALYVLGDILVPFSLACLIAVLLNPLCNRLERHIPRGVAIFTIVILAIVVVAAIVYFLSHEIAAFSELLPALKARFLQIEQDAKLWLHQRFGLGMAQQMQLVNRVVADGGLNMKSTMNGLLSTTGIAILLPIYVYFILYYKPLILDVVFRLFSEQYSLNIAEILGETKSAIQSYVVGLLIEMVIVSAMNSIALALLGVPSAILLGVIGGILNLIPYLGGLVATALPVLMATINADGYTTQLAVIGAYLTIQFIDNNILVPQIVSSKVEINALASIVIVLMGGQLWGLSGMFLSIPFIAVVKIIFDRIGPLKPWGALLGTKIPEQHAGVKWLARLEQKLWRKANPKT
jgi:predicted PurR-regulated permease PerM